MANLRDQAKRLVGEVASVTSGAGNEANLRHEVEKILEQHCSDLGIPWVPFQLERLVRSPDSERRRFVDVAHGAVVIEYEPPSSFGGREGANFRSAQGQAAEYAELLQLEEGRPLEDYILVAWDGSHIGFGWFDGGEIKWSRLTPFNQTAAQRLLGSLRSNGRPLVHPRLLSQLVGPESQHGRILIPRFFEAILRSQTPGDRTTKTQLLFTEWRRLFGQVVGVQSDRLRELIEQQAESHGRDYGADPVAYYFALNTYIALVAKFVAALSLPACSEDLLDPGVGIRDRVRELESGRLFRSGGVANMLAGDFFSWYIDDLSWRRFSRPIEDLVSSLGGTSFDMTRKSVDATRDLFKGIYQSFVPRAIRHSLGEYYTPDWLAAHALDRIKWTPEDPLLDPTCGSGTFLLEAVRRRLAKAKPTASPAELLSGIWGIDLNPLAVLAARASLVVSLSPRLSPDDHFIVPVFLADAINPAEARGRVYRHRLQTELGVKTFEIPQALVELPSFFGLFARVRELVDADWQTKRILTALEEEFSEVAALRGEEREEFVTSLGTLVELHDHGWDGIWCAILADRFAAGSIPRVSHIAGNPPWVKWSHLPPEYAGFIKERCLELGVFSEDRWVGGIESDISTVITYEVIEKWLKRKGVLAFFITGTVFANESSQGFRRFSLQDSGLTFRAVSVEDFKEVAPFEGVSNHATLLIIKRDAETAYPIPYCIWIPPRTNSVTQRAFVSAEEFRRAASKRCLVAAPVPGTDAGPWLKGTRNQHKRWQFVFDASTSSHYVARKGITTDRNGIFFVEVLERREGGNICEIQNDPSLGRTRGVRRVRERVEDEHVFPLLRGRGVSPFRALPDEKYRVLLPQRGMHGDPELPAKAPGVHRFLARFESELLKRSSYRRFQRGEPYWSVWSTGAYTFSPFKVVWREMVSGRFAAAYIGTFEDPMLGSRLVVPDHKLYFVPLETEAEAAYVTGMLNAPMVTEAVGAYAAQLSLGVSVMEYLAIPRFDLRSRLHTQVARLAKEISEGERQFCDASADELDGLVGEILGIPEALRRR